MYNTIELHSAIFELEQMTRNITGCAEPKSSKSAIFLIVLIHTNFPNFWWAIYFYIGMIYYDWMSYRESKYPQIDTKYN